MTTCTHRYVIEPPNGSVSLGVCRRCGKQRWFPNAGPERDFGRSGQIESAWPEREIYVPAQRRVD